MKTSRMDKQREYTEDGEAVLNMVVKDDTYFLSVFSDENTPIISEDVSDFLETSAQSAPHKQPLALQIRSDCIDEQEKVMYERGIKKYYKDKAESGRRELKRDVWIGIVLAILGLLTLAVAYTVEFVFDSVIWTEAIDIAAWVFLWESVDILVFKIRGLRLDILRYEAFARMPIAFFPLDKGEPTVSNAQKEEGN